MAVLGGFSSPVGGRLEVLHMSEDGLTLRAARCTSSSTSACVMVNPYTGAIYLALNGPSYIGNGPNLIKEFRPAATDGVTDWKDERGFDIYLNPAVDQVQLRVSKRGWTDIRGHDLQGRARVNFSPGKPDDFRPRQPTLHAQSEDAHMTRVLYIQ